MSIAAVGKSAPEVHFDQKAATDRVVRLIGIPGKSGEEAAVVEAIRSELLDAGVPSSAISIDPVHRKSPYPRCAGRVLCVRDSWIVIVSRSLSFKGSGSSGRSTPFS